MAKQPRKAQRAKVPVTRNPLFPAIVALWFAALFGLGSLAIRPGLLESVVLATHLDLLVPAAAPPLGVSARIALALVLAIGGGLLGAKIARRIARPKPEAHELRRSGPVMKDALRAQEAGAARRPISAHEDFGESGIAASDGGIAMGGRRRSLAIEEDEGEFRMFETAPLPGGQPPVFDPAEPEAEAQALDLGEFEPLPSAPVQTFAEAAIEPAPRQVFEPAAAAPAEPEEVQPPQFAPFAATVAQPIDFSRPHEVALEATGAAPLEFSRPDPQVSSAPFAAPAFVEAAPAPEAAAPEVAVEPITAPVAQSLGTDAVVAALDDLGLIELTERFARTLRQRREKLNGPVVEMQTEPAPAVFETPAPVSFTPIEPEPVVVSEQATTAAFQPQPAAPSALPASMRPLDFDGFDDEDEDEDLAKLLPLRKFAPMGESVAAEPEPVAVPQFAEPVAASAEAVEVSASVDEASEAAIEAEGYSSLLDLVKQPEQHPQFVRIEEPEPDDAAIEPVVIFPGQAARHGLGQAPAMPAPFAAPAAVVEAPIAQPAAPAAFEVASQAESTLRRFDSPAAARPGQPVASTAPPVPAQDPEETERALRAALATLQRMSGAA